MKTRQYVITGTLVALSALLSAKADAKSPPERSDIVTVTKGAGNPKNPNDTNKAYALTFLTEEDELNNITTKKLSLLVQDKNDKDIPLWIDMLETKKDGKTETDRLSDRLAITKFDVIFKSPSGDESGTDPTESKSFTIDVTSDQDTPGQPPPLAFKADGTDITKSDFEISNLSALTQGMEVATFKLKSPYVMTLPDGTESDTVTINALEGTFTSYHPEIKRDVTGHGGDDKSIGHYPEQAGPFTALTANFQSASFPPTKTSEPGAYALLGSLCLTGAAFLRRKRAR